MLVEHRKFRKGEEFELGFRRSVSTKREIIGKAAFVAAFVVPWSEPLDRSRARSHFP